MRIILQNWNYWISLAKLIKIFDLKNLIRVNLPNSITGIGIVLIVWLNVLIWNEPNNRLLILLLAVCVSLSDLIDGWLARYWQVVSSTGKVLDVCRDKFFSCSLFAYFLKELWLYQESGPWLALIKGLIILILVIEALFVLIWTIMIFGWIIGSIKELEVSVHWTGKVKTDAYFIAIGWWFLVGWQPVLQTYLYGGLIFLLFAGFISSILSLPPYFQFYGKKNN